MVSTWALTDEYRCPMCFGPCEIMVVEQDEEDGYHDVAKLHCLECDYRWEKDV